MRPEWPGLIENGTRVVLVGEAPGPSYDPALSRALWPNPPGCAGARLQRLTGLDPDNYVRLTERTNLYNRYPGERWSVVDARERAALLAPHLQERTVVLVGRRVGTAFGLRDISFHQWVDVEFRAAEDELTHEFRAACVPHTSGRSRWYNDPNNREESREFWAAVDFWRTV